MRMFKVRIFVKNKIFTKFIEACSEMDAKMSIRSKYHYTGICAYVMYASPISQ